MTDSTLTVLDERGAALDPAVTVTGRVTVAQQPRPWEAPAGLDPADVPSHILAAPSGSEGLRPLRYVVAEDGRRWRVMGLLEVSTGLDPQVERWRLRLEEEW